MKDMLKKALHKPDDGERLVREHGNEADIPAWEIPKKDFPVKHCLTFAVVIAVIIIAVTIVAALPKRAEKQEKAPEIVTVSTLEEIIHVNKLSTFESVYNGVARSSDTDDPDYHVSYESTVKVGIDFDKVTFEEDTDAQKFYITIPKAYITEIIVDDSSLEFIFQNDKADALGVYQEAYRKCIEDVNKECAEQEAIFAFATQNAENIITALTKPLIDEFYPGYIIEFKEGN